MVVATTATIAETCRCISGRRAKRLLRSASSSSGFIAGGTCCTCCSGPVCSVIWRLPGRSRPSSRCRTSGGSFSSSIRMLKVRLCHRNLLRTKRCLLVLWRYFLWELHEVEPNLLRLSHIKLCAWKSYNHNSPLFAYPLRYWLLKQHINLFQNRNE